VNWSYECLKNQNRNLHITYVAVKNGTAKKMIAGTRL
jgi:hypothetical protein